MALLGPVVLAMLDPPREAEAGSAGTQPAEEYLGRRCADGTGAPRATLRDEGPPFSIGHRSYALKIHRTPPHPWLA
jgi:hypothetical protein